MTAEEWRSVHWAPGYEVSDMGRVRSIDRTINRKDGTTQRCKGTVLSPALSLDGYPFVHIRINMVGRTARLHVLVLEAFAGLRPEGMFGLHNNGEKLDNRLVNLRWGTPQENCQDTIKHGNNRLAAKTHCLNGHEFSPDNTLIGRGGRRICRACAKVRDAEYRRRKRLGLTGTHNRHQDHCIHGHPFSGDNLYVTPNGYRNCRECHRIAGLARFRDLQQKRKSA